jgi:hypothetical protein
MRLFAVLILLLSNLAAAATGDLELVIKSAPSYTGQFTHSFELRCKAGLCEVENKGSIRRQGKLKQEAITRELGRVLEFHKKPMQHEGVKPLSVVREIRFSGPGQKFEHKLGPLLDKSNLSARLHRNYNKALDELIRRALTEAK